jgi:hypothetical protein
MRYVLLVVALLACKESAKPSRKPTEHGSPVVATVSDAANAVAEDAAPRAPTISLPACQQHASFDRIPEGPHSSFFAGAYLAGSRLLVTASSKNSVAVHEYDLDKHVWRELPKTSVPGASDRLDFASLTTDRGLFNASYTNRESRVLDVAKGVWTTGPKIPLTTEHFFLWNVGGTVVVMPFRPCGFAQPDLTWRLVNKNFVQTSSTLAMRARATQQVVAGKLVIWGGTGFPNAPSGDLACGDDNAGTVPLADGAVLDPKTGAWTAMAAGPPAFRDWKSIVASHFLFAYEHGNSTANLWRYDVLSNAWKELGRLPTAFTRVDSWDEGHSSAIIGKSLMLIHGGYVEPSSVIVDIESGTMRESSGVAVKQAAVSAIDDHHLVLLPHAPAGSKPRAYLQDVDNGSWCELAWISDPSFVDNGASPYYRLFTRYKNGVLAFGPHTELTGFVATISAPTNGSVK